MRRMRRGAKAAQAGVDSLPPGGVRFDMGSRLDDVAWDPKHQGRLAMVGASSPHVTVVEIGEVGDTVLPV